MAHISYALQVCDRGNNQNITRYCSNSKQEVIFKCVTSFFLSVVYAAKERPESFHTIQIFDDRSSEDTIAFLNRCCHKFNLENIKVTLVQTKHTGLMESVRECYEWLKNTTSDIVYQVQDDYMYDETAIFEMISMQFQLLGDVKTHAVLYPYNCPRHWLDIYRYIPTPRVVVPGLKRYWIQLYDVACTFMTTRINLINNWKYIELFLNLSSTDVKLETKSLNKMFVENGILGMQPVVSIALHMQSEIEKDPFIDWETKWNNIVPI